MHLRTIVGTARAAVLGYTSRTGLPTEQAKIDPTAPLGLLFLVPRHLRPRTVVFTLTSQTIAGGILAHRDAGRSNRSWC